MNATPKLPGDEFLQQEADTPESSLPEPSFGSDLGFADRIANRFRDTIRFDHSRQSWLVFEDESGWKHDDAEMIRARVQGYVRELIAWAQREAAKPADSGDPKAAQKAADLITAMSRLGNTTRISNALREAQSIAQLSVVAEQLDAEPGLFGLTNGVFDLEANRFTPPDRGRLVTLKGGCDYNAQAKCPTFESFMHRVQPDPEMRLFLQKLAGSTLWAGNADQRLPFFFGHGANGKSTFTEAVSCVLGSYSKGLTEALLYTKNNSRPPDLEIAGLCGARLAIGCENSAGDGLNEGLLKALTGGDKIKGRFHYKNFVEYVPTFKIWLVGNHRPRINGTDDGIWRRFLLIDWPVQIPDGERDPNLKNKLFAEAPGILNWMLDGCRRWQAEGLNPPSSCTKLTQDFRQESDTLGQFIEDRTETSPGQTVHKSRLYQLYVEWADEAGIRHKLTKSSFRNRLAMRGWAETTLSHGRQGAWLDRRIKAEPSHDGL